MGRIIVGIVVIGGLVTLASFGGLMYRHFTTPLPFTATELQPVFANQGFLFSPSQIGARIEGKRDGLTLALRTDLLLNSATLTLRESNTQMTRQALDLLAQTISPQWFASAEYAAWAEQAVSNCLNLSHGDYGGAEGSDPFLPVRYTLSCHRLTGETAISAITVAP